MRLSLFTAVLLAGCASVPADPSGIFFRRLSALCGRAFEGRLVAGDAADAAMRGERLVMHVRECSAGEVRIPFHVGADRSRTWVVTRTADGLRLKHDHRHEDGGADALTRYGGDSRGPGHALRRLFPADAESIALFRREGREASVANIWAVELDGRHFAYELARPGRFFRVEFDVSRPVAPPPAPWGAAAR